MMGFVVLGLLLAILVQNQSQLLQLLTTPVALGIGLTVMVASLLLGYLKKISTITWHDVFACSSLLVWFGYWSSQFDGEAPMFFFFPLYYSLLTSIVTLSLINKSQNFDLDSVVQLRFLEKSTKVHSSVFVAIVLLGILVTDHYGIYPIAMTIFIVRHTIVACLEIIDKG